MSRSMAACLLCVLVLLGSVACGGHVRQLSVEPTQSENPNPDIVDGWREWKFGMTYKEVKKTLNDRGWAIHAAPGLEFDFSKAEEEGTWGEEAYLYPRDDKGNRGLVVTGYPIAPGISEEYTSLGFEFDGDRRESHQIWVAFFSDEALAEAEIIRTLDARYQRVKVKTPGASVRWQGARGGSVVMFGEQKDEVFGVGGEVLLIVYMNPERSRQADEEIEKLIQSDW